MSCLAVKLSQNIFGRKFIFNKPSFRSVTNNWCLQVVMLYELSCKSTDDHSKHTTLLCDENLIVVCFFCIFLVGILNFIKMYHLEMFANACTTVRHRYTWDTVAIVSKKSEPVTLSAHLSRTWASKDSR
jgi:hypothetical protein